MVACILAERLAGTSEQRWNGPEFIQSNYHYFLYLMASTSQGNFLRSSTVCSGTQAGDFRMWGAQHLVDEPQLLL